MPGEPTYEELMERVKELEREVSECQYVEEELQKSKGILNAVFHSLPFDVFTLDPNNRYFLQNSVCRNNWGDLIGKCPEDLPVNKETLSLWLDNNRRALSGETVTDEVEYNWLEGRKSYYYNIIKPIRHEDKIFGILGILVDISELKQTQEALIESEKRFRRLVETMNDGIGIQDKNGLITYVNNKFCQMLDYKQDDFIGKPVTNFLDDQNRQILKHQTFVRRKGKAKPYEIEWTCKDGRKIQTIMSPQALFNDDGQFKGSFSVITDISTLKQTEELLLKSEERYRSLAENSLIGFWQTTLDGYTIYINPAMCRMLEIEDSEEIHGKTYDSFYDDKNREIIKRELVKREKGISSTYEVELIGEKGTKRNVMISGAPLFLSEDKIHSAIGTFIDITDKKRAEKALMKAHDELEQRVKERTRELEIKTQNLEEINIAMKVLLKKREEDKKDIEDNILTNVIKLIDPYFEKIRKTKLDSQQNAFLNIMESNIQEITSQFARKISLQELNLTPTEIQIANMIRQGNSSKEIAEIMNVSIRTVDAHRRNIRKKIGLNQKRANLRSYLLSLH